MTVSHKTTDPRKWYGLTSGGHYATISASLASGRNRRQLEKIIELSLLHSSQSVLVEFSDILLATFVPILENLQKMQRPVASLSKVGLFLTRPLNTL